MLNWLVQNNRTFKKALFLVYSSVLEGYEDYPLWSEAGEYIIRALPLIKFGYKKNIFTDDSKEKIIITGILSVIFSTNLSGVQSFRSCILLITWEITNMK